jgi:hypothetical protein
MNYITITKFGNGLFIYIRMFLYIINTCTWLLLYHCTIHLSKFLEKIDIEKYDKIHYAIKYSIILFEIMNLSLNLKIILLIIIIS